MSKLKFRNRTFVIIEAVIFFIAAFFIFSGVCEASISSSKSYKLQTAATDGGGSTGTSASYSAETSIGSSFVTAPNSGTNYKIQAGVLSTMNTMPEVSIISYNDGLLILDDTPRLEWTYSDKDGHLQDSYQVQISKDNFATTIVDSGVVSSDSGSFTAPTLPTVEAGVNYRWRVRVNDGYDYSGWGVATYGFRLTTVAMEVPIIWAKVSLTGENISSQLWQDCETPYMYWEYPVTGLDIVGYSYAWGSMPDDQIDTTSFSYQTPQGLLSDGIRVFNLKGQNTAGNWSEVASFEIWLDRGAPLIGNYSPSTGTIISTDTPTVLISVSDDKSGVNPNSIIMKVNKSRVEASYDEKTRDVVYIPSIPLSEGDNVISLEVGDFVGNRATPLVWSFIVDTEAPTGSIIINNQDAVTNSVYVNLSLSANDTITGVKNMSISNDGVFDTEAWELFDPRKDSWILPAISGTRKVYVKFKDGAGNVSGIFSDTVELIIIAPDTIITSGPSVLTTSTEALFTFKATVEGCIFRWKFDDEEWSDWAENASVRKEDLPEGNRYFKVQAAKDVNNNGRIDLDEIDPVPEERTWTIGKAGVIKPEIPKKKPFRFWKEE